MSPYRSGRRAARLLGFLALVLPALACSRSQGAAEEALRPAPTSQPGPRYTTRGTVRALSDKRTDVTIAHENIPGYMKAMTMMFDVKEPDMLREVHVGDRVSFTFADYGNGRLVIESITRIP